MNEFLKELIDKQLKCDEDKKLNVNDMKRICKYTESSLFGQECCLWKGNINNNKSSYINFYFNKKKQALHRLLYINYIGDINNKYLTFSCKNKGMCCNINHIKLKHNDDIIIKKTCNKIIRFD